MLDHLLNLQIALYTLLCISKLFLSYYNSVFFVNDKSGLNTTTFSKYTCLI